MVYSENMTNKESQTAGKKAQFIGVTLQADEAAQVDRIAAEREWSRAQVVRHFFRRGIAEAAPQSTEGKAA